MTLTDTNNCSYRSFNPFLCPCACPSESSQQTIAEPTLLELSNTAAKGSIVVPFNAMEFLCPNQVICEYFMEEEKVNQPLRYDEKLDLPNGLFRTYLNTGMLTDVWEEF